MQNYLHREAAARKKHVDKLEGELDQSVEDAKVLCDDNDHLRRELRQKRRALATYEYVLAQHVPNAARVVASTAAGAEAFSPEAHRSSAAHVCKTCGKVFSSRHYLLKHCSRRTSNRSTRSPRRGRVKRMRVRHKFRHPTKTSRCPRRDVSLRGRQSCPGNRAKNVRRSAGNSSR